MDSNYNFLHGLKKVIINIGSNVDPPLPLEGDPFVLVIALEPFLGTAKIPYHDRLFFIVCAIADVLRFQIMHQLNIGVVSSSLHNIKNFQPYMTELGYTLTNTHFVALAFLFIIYDCYISTT